MSMFTSGTIDSFSAEYAFLSNFYYSPIRFRGVSYPTVEHAYQASKAQTKEERILISLASTPGKAKRLGKTLNIREDWESIKVDVMYKCLRKKFKIPELADQLLKTGDKKLIENNMWGDKIWGVYKGEGQNLLGKLLMKVREELKNG